jgi:glyoxylase-like metal-dependent hydrolase (beta-lactamase superfamily II)
MAACSGSDASEETATTGGNGTSAPPASSTVGTEPSVAVAEPPVLPAPEPATGEPAADPAPESTAPGDLLQWSQVLVGSVSEYVLVRGNRAAVVDTGNPGSADQIGASLATFGLTFDDVGHIILTRSHPDHIGSFSGILDTGAPAVGYAGAADFPNINSPIELSAIGDGDDVFGLQIISTPAHTPGSISVLDVGIRLLLAGDAMNGNAGGTGISGPNARFTPDMDTGSASVAKLATFAFDSVGFGHGQPIIGGADAIVRGLAASI